jgi:hypothetical protein
MPINQNYRHITLKLKLAENVEKYSQFILKF